MKYFNQKNASLPWYQFQSPACEFVLGKCVVVWVGAMGWVVQRLPARPTEEQEGLATACPGERSQMERDPQYSSWPPGPVGV